MIRLGHHFRGDGLAARALRSGALTFGSYATSQALRLISNLILTRLLFPEAFGVMVLVSVFMMGLAMFSDVGTGPAIMGSKRGDDPDFLDTAWTIQVIRGACLFVVATGLAWPMAWYYQVPELTQLLPVAALTLLIMGFNPTRLESANRHLMLGRVTVIDFITQITGIIAAILLAWWLKSVWALVLSGLVSVSIQLVLYWRFLPGQANRFRWEPAAVTELIRFGKWVFLSTVAGFALSQGDKVVLGKYLSLDVLGVYNIGYFLASFPLLLGGMMARKLLIPIYRELPPGAAPENFAKLSRMRFATSAMLLAILAVFMLGGVLLVTTLYDPRYAAAGAIVVVLSAMQVPQLVALTYDQAALASGASRRFFVLAAARAALMIAGLVLGFETAGLFGALIGQGLAWTLAYPVVIWLARKEGAWDPRHDLTVFLAGLVLAFLAFWLNWPDISALFAPNLP